MKNYNEKVMDDFMNNLIEKKVIIESTNDINTQKYSGILLSVCDGFVLLKSNISERKWLINLNNTHITEAY